MLGKSRELTSALNKHKNDIGIENIRELIKEKDYEEAFYQSASSGYSDIVAGHVKFGADINAKSIDGATPLITLCREGDIEAAGILIENGADMSITDDRGKRALDYLKNKKDILEIVANISMKENHIVSGRFRNFTALYFWLNKPIYIYGLIFLFISVIFSAFAFVRSFIFLIKKQNSNYNSGNIEKTFKELIFILFLFVPITILSFMIFRSKPGTFHYLNSAFSISFVPIILFFYQIKNKMQDNAKIQNKNLRVSSYIYIYIYISLNILSLTLELTRYYKLFEEPRNYDNLKRVAEFIEKDSAGRKIKIENNFSGIQNRQFEDTFSIYLPEYEIKISEEPEIIYLIRDNLTAINFGKERSDRDMQYLSDNNAIELTNIGGYTIFKFPETMDGMK